MHHSFEDAWCYNNSDSKRNGTQFTLYSLTLAGWHLQCWLYALISLPHLSCPKEPGQECTMCHNLKANHTLSCHVPQERHMRCTLWHDMTRRTHYRNTEFFLFTFKESWIVHVGALIIVVVPPWNRGIMFPLLLGQSRWSFVVIKTSLPCSLTRMLDWTVRVLVLLTLL